MKAIIKWMLPLLFVLFISACSKGIQGNGETTTEQRTLNPFTKIEVNGQFNVMLTGGSPAKVSVTVDKNLQPYVLTEIKGDTLVISAKDNQRLISNNPLAVNIRDPKIVAISANGDNNIKGSELIQDSLSLKSKGSSNMELSGKASNLTIEILGSANINTVGLHADVVNVDVSGSGKVSVEANKNLNVTIKGSGDVRYAGNPVIQQKIYGDGRINALENK